MNNLERFQQLKRQVEQIEREYHEARGVLSELARQLSEEYQCDVNQAKQKVAELERVEETFRRKYHDALNKFCRRWGKHLSSDDR